MSFFVCLFVFHLEVSDFYFSLTLYSQFLQNFTISRENLNGILKSKLKQWAFYYKGRFLKRENTGFKILRQSELGELSADCLRHMTKS